MHPGLAAAHPGNRPALRVAASGGWWRTDYATLARAVTARADQLGRAGLRAGQVVLCPTRPAVDFALMTQALAALEAALLPVAPGLDADVRAALIRQTGAEWVWEPSPIGAEINPGPLSGRLLATGQAPAPPPHPDPLALLVQTSGSTGAPKVAMLTRDALRASCSRINVRLGLTAEDAWLCCLPRQHIGGLAIAYRCALAGAELVVHEDFDAGAVRATLAGGGITHVSLVPPMLARLLDRNPDPPPGLRVALLGGQALAPTLARRAVLAGWPLYAGYAMTEACSQIAGAWVGPAPAAGPAAAWPDLALLPDVVVADADPCWRAGSVAGSGARPGAGPGAGAPRPLRLRAPMVMAGYANPDRRRGDGLRDGWLVTSDLACRTPTGALRVDGRADDVLVIGGVNVLPAAVEALLAGAPGLGEVAVIGLPEPVWGFWLVACYTGEAAPAALDAWARAHLPGPQRPRAWRRVRALPVLASGKRNLAALRRLAAGDGG